jgi:hypothetical protein
LVEPLVWNKQTGNLVGGHQRLKVLKEQGVKEVEVSVVDLEPTKEKALNIALNKAQGEWDFPKLKDLLQEIDTGEFDIGITGFDEQEIEDLMNQLYTPDEAEHKSLKDKFIIPPFSVFDTRQGYWQDRKRAWLDLGIRSEIGRGENLLNFSDVCSLKSNTSLFDPVLAEVCYRWFNIDKGLILDPFAGGSVRGIVACYLDYKYTGIDLSSKQIEANLEQADLILKDKIKPDWIIGNSLNIDKLVKDNVDFIFSCPPYFDLEKYSEDTEDLSNLNWEDFKNQYRDIINKSCSFLKEDRFACFVVSEIRDKNGIYRDFVNYTKSCFMDSGLSFYNDIVLINVAGSLPIRVGKQFKNRKIGKMHQNILVFYKGNPKNIKDNFKELDFSGIDIMEDYTGMKAELVNDKT